MGISDKMVIVRKGKKRKIMFMIFWNWKQFSKSFVSSSFFFFWDQSIYYPIKNKNNSFWYDNNNIIIVIIMYYLINITLFSYPCGKSKLLFSHAGQLKQSFLIWYTKFKEQKKGQVLIRDVLLQMKRKLM